MKKQTWFYLVLLAALVLGALLTVPARAESVIYVDSTALGADNGSSWADAFTDLQAALAESGPGTDIWVAAGTYYPTTGADRTASFIMMNEVALYGGFPSGGGDGTFEARDWMANPTILSGDIGIPGNVADNSYHVVIADDTDDSSVLDGFFISGGNADGTGIDRFGGGILISGGSPMLSNLIITGNFAERGGGLYSANENYPMLKNIIFVGNTATIFGGGMYTLYSGPTLTNVDFEANEAVVGGGMYNFDSVPVLINCNFKNNTASNGSGGMHNQESSPELTNCTFVGNTAIEFAGGGMTNNSSSPILTNCAFIDNSAGSAGGGINNGGVSFPIITNCLFEGNHAGWGGGGMRNVTNAGPQLINCTFSGNSADSFGGAMLNQTAFPVITNSTFTLNSAGTDGGGIRNQESAEAVMTNSILWGNTGGSIANVGGSAVVNYSIVQGGYPGMGNLDNDPLLSRLGNMGGFAKTHALLPGSPARDAGNPADCPGTDQRGMVRPRDSAGDGTLRCDMGAFEVGPPNDAWTRAIDVSTGPADVQEYIDQPGLSRWYKFQVSPGSRVNVELDPGNVNLDIALFGDIQAVYDELTAPEALEEESLIPKLSAEFAAAAHSPFAYSPFAYSPFAYSPFAYSPFAYSPFAYSPFAYSPFAYSPFAYSPFAYSPFAYSPFAYSPFAYSPFAYSPFAYSPFAYSPFAYSPEAEYTSAQMRTLLAISAQEGTAMERIEANTWNNRGHFYVRISGRNGAFDLGQPFTLRMTQDLGVCDGLEWIERNAPISVPAPFPGYEVIFLTDWDRFDQNDPQFETLQTALSSFAVSVNGIVVDVGQDLFVQQGNAVADAAPECLYAKNQVAGLIKDIVTAYRDAGHPIEYVVLVGNDNIIPYFRYPDRAEIGRERDYNPPVLVGTSSYASLAFDHFLGQDAYGTDLELSIQYTTLPLPDLAVGRLVETPADILNMLNVYAGTLIPGSALVTGYCFLADAAEAIAWELETGLGSDSVNTLITPQEISPAEREGIPPEEAPWPASLLAENLFSQRHDLIFLAGHFSAQGTLAADYETRLYAYELLESGVDLENALVYSAGCHSGYNIVNEHGVPYVTLEPDWAQAFAQKGATFIGGTGYQYGDTDFLEYSERLYLEFTRELRCGDGSVGKALVRAKQAYLAGITDIIGIDEKAVQISTLFGLPMFRVEGLDNTGCPTAPPSSIVAATMGYGDDPGAFLNLQFADVTVSSQLTLETVFLRNVVEPHIYVDAIYFSGSGGAVTKPAEPILPLERRNVYVDGTVLRGVGFRGANYADLPGLIPLTGGATTETRAARTPFQTDVLYPLQPWSVNYFAQLIDPDSGITWLDVKPAQFMSDPAGDGWTGTWRRFDDVKFRLFYSNHTATLAGGAVPSLAAPPAILQVLARSDEGVVHFQVQVAGDPAAGVQEVWVTYTGLPCNGTACWQSFDLAQNENDSTLWEGTLTVNGAPSGELRYIVQAVNGVGLVTMLTNHGEYYQVDVDPADPSAGADAALPPEATSLSLLSPPASGAYSTEVSFSAVLTTDGAPLADQRLTFALGGQQRSVVTDTSGAATVTFPLNAVPGSYSLSVSFSGSSAYQRSSTSSGFVINKQGTTLAFLEDSLIVQLNDEVNQAIPHKTVLFVISGADDTWNVVETTNFLGQAAPRFLALPPATYTVTAYFGQVVGMVDLTDLYYHSASAVTSLEVLPEPGILVIGLSLPEDPVEIGAEVLVEAQFMGAANPHTAIWHWGDGMVCNTGSDILCALTDPDGDIPGTVTGSHSYVDPGIYAGTLTIIDDDGNAIIVTFEVNVISVSDPDLHIFDLSLPLDPVAVGTMVDAQANFMGNHGPYSAIWGWGDGTYCDTSIDEACHLTEPDGDTPGTVTGSHIYAEPGVYTVTLTITDAQENSVEAVYEFIVVYDPAGGFVTAGGWIWSETEWCQLDDVCAAAEGRANFSFVTRYHRRVQVPRGNMLFNFTAGGLRFKADSFQWLVVNRAESNAQFKGWGTINGGSAPNGELYEFMIWARDGGRQGEDNFRIKIWYMENGQEVIVYDNGSHKAIGGGSIKIH